MTEYFNNGGCPQHLQIVHCVCLSILFHDCCEVSSCVLQLPRSGGRVCFEANVCRISNRLSFAFLREKYVCCVMGYSQLNALELGTFGGCFSG